MSLNTVKHIIIVMSGKGGVGKSTVAVNLAFGLAREGYFTGLMDIDLHGPSVVSMAGIEDQRFQVGNDNQMIPIQKNEHLFIVSLASLLEHPDSPVIWRGPMKMGVIEQFIKEVAWPKLDYLVVDCPPGTGDEVLSIIQLLQRVTGTIIVSTPQKIAYLDVRKSIQFARKMGVPLLGLVENMSAIQCPHCHQSIYLSDSQEAQRASKDFKIDLLASIPWDAGLMQEGDSGFKESKPGISKEIQEAFGTLVKKVIQKTSQSAILCDFSGQCPSKDKNCQSCEHGKK